MIWPYLSLLMVGTVWGSANYILSILSRRKEGEKDHERKTFSEFVRYLAANWLILLVICCDKLSTVLFVVTLGYVGSIISGHNCVAGRQRVQHPGRADDRRGQAGLHHGKDVRLRHNPDRPRAFLPLNNPIKFIKPLIRGDLIREACRATHDGLA